ncbi:neuropeptide receptor npr-1-like [Saccostrea cucullata]|uniref:neuropeptide receptor npr-1-like n=1 Tax=Saccostrea cuccullata TaxID=36930 RepID=UPI002ED60737
MEIMIFPNHDHTDHGTNTNISQSNSTSSETILLEFNHHILLDRLPNTIIMMLLMFFGVIGNSIVLYVYLSRLSHWNVERYFIPFLAMVDFAACVIGPTFSLLENLYSVTFPSAIVCKTMWYATCLTSGISVSILFIVAINRYLKLCRPHSRQMTIHHKRIFMAVMLSIVSLILTPMVFFVELQYINFTYKNETFIGVTCAPHNPEQTFEETIYFGCMFGIISGIIIVTAILYVAVGKVVFKRLRKTRKGSVPPSPRLVHHQINLDRSNSVFSVLAAVTSIKKDNSNDVSNVSNSGRDLESTSRSVDLLRSNQGTYRQYRLNFYIMFLTIFICNTVSFVPSMVYLFLNESDVEFWFTHDLLVLNIHLTVHRMFVINHVLNPFIYGYFDLTFRKHVIATFRKLARRPLPDRQLSTS